MKTQLAPEERDRGPPALALAASDHFSRAAELTPRAFRKRNLMRKKSHAPVVKAVVLVRLGVPHRGALPWSKWELLLAVPQEAGRSAGQGIVFLDNQPDENAAAIWCSAPHEESEPGVEGCPREDHMHPLVDWAEARESGQISLELGGMEHYLCTFSLRYFQAQINHLSTGIRHPLTATETSKKKAKS